MFHWPWTSSPQKETCGSSLGTCRERIKPLLVHLIKHRDVSSTTGKVNVQTLRAILSAVEFTRTVRWTAGG